MSDHWDLKMFPWSNQPRFYPPGEHPAMAALKTYRERVQGWIDLHGETPDARAALDYAEQKILEFEVGETDAKLRAYSAVNRGQRGGSSPGTGDAGD